MARLFFASFVTVGLLLGMVCGVILAALVSTDNVNLGFAITLTIIINARHLADQPVDQRPVAALVQQAGISRRRRGANALSGRACTRA